MNVSSFCPMRKTRQKACCSEAEFHQGSIMITLEAMVRLRPTGRWLVVEGRREREDVRPPQRRDANITLMFGFSAKELMALSRANRLILPWYCDGS